MHIHGQEQQGSLKSSVLYVTQLQRCTTQSSVQFNLFKVKYTLIIRNSNTNTRCVAMPRLMAYHWVGVNSGPIFRRLWTKVY